MSTSNTGLCDADFLHISCWNILALVLVRQSVIPSNLTLSAFHHRDAYLLKMMSTWLLFDPLHVKFISLTPKALKYLTAVSMYCQYKAELQKLGTTLLLGTHNFLLWGAVLWTIECLAKSLASIHHWSIENPLHDPLTVVTTMDISWDQNCLLLKTTGYVEWLCKRKRSPDSFHDLGQEIFTPIKLNSVSMSFAILFLLCYYFLQH
jgi:hypothetical protein